MSEVVKSQTNKNILLEKLSYKEQMISKNGEPGTSAKPENNPATSQSNLDYKITSLTISYPKNKEILDGAIKRVVNKVFQSLPPETQNAVKTAWFKKPEPLKDDELGPPPTVSINDEEDLIATEVVITDGEISHDSTTMEKNDKQSGTTPQKTDENNYTTHHPHVDLDESPDAQDVNRKLSIQYYGSRKHEVKNEQKRIKIGDEEFILTSEVYTSLKTGFPFVISYTLDGMKNVEATGERAFEEKVSKETEEPRPIKKKKKQLGPSTKCYDPPIQVDLTESPSTSATIRSSKSIQANKEIQKKTKMNPSKSAATRSSRKSDEKKQ